MLREEREEEGEGVRVGVAVAKDVGGEKREYLEREEEARGESVVDELPDQRVVVVEAYLGH